ncbi:MAG: ATP-binding protein, partial [Candidatus Hodarchaeota archaeon]
LDLSEDLFGWIGNKLYQKEISEEELVLGLQRRFVGAIFGKQGSGKTYTANVLLEEVLKMQASLEIPLAAVVIDPMGVYFSLKFPNTVEEGQMDDFQVAPQGFRRHVSVLVPEGVQDRMAESEYDGTVALKPSQVSLDAWGAAFGLGMESAALGALDAIIDCLKAENPEYSIDDMLDLLNEDEFLNKEKISPQTANALHNRFRRARRWGIFNDQGLNLSQVFKRNKITIIDVSEVQFEGIAQLLTAMLAGEAYRVRKSIARKVALAQSKGELPDISKDGWLPAILLVIEEAHNFLPKHKARSESSVALEKFIKEGRSAGCSVLLVDQQPGALNTNALTQLDFAIVHNLTHEADLTAIKKICPSAENFDLQSLKTLKPGFAVFLPSHERAERMNIHEITYFKVRPRHSKHIARTELPEAFPVEVSPKEEELTDVPLEKPIEAIELQIESLEPDMKVREDRYSISTDDLDDILQIQHILVIYKDSGISLISKGTGFAVDTQIVSGFITAMTGLLGEIKKTHEPEERIAFKEFRHEIGEQGMIIWIAEGTFCVTALLLKTPVSNMLKQRLKDFTRIFEKEYENDLEDFDGIIEPFEKADSLIQTILGTGVLIPMRIGSQVQLSTFKSNTELYSILQLFKAKQDPLSSQEGLYLEEFLPLAIRSLRRITWEALLENVLKAIQMQIILPQDPEVIIHIKTPPDKLLLEAKTEDLTLPEYQAEPVIETEFKVTSPSTGIIPVSKQPVEIELSASMTEGLTGQLESVLSQLAHMFPPTLPPHLVEDILHREMVYGNWRRDFSSFRSEILETLDEVGQIFRGLLSYGYKALSETQKNSLKGPIILFQRIDSTTNVTEKKVISICPLKTKRIIVVIGEQK